MKRRKKKLSETPSEIKLETLKFLVEKSKSQLTEARSSFDESKKTSSIISGISTFLFTISLAVGTGFNENEIAKLLILIPITLVMISISFLIRNFKSVPLPNGNTRDWYQKNLISSSKDMLYEELTENLDDIEAYKTQTRIKNLRIEKSMKLNLWTLVGIILILIYLIISSNFKLTYYGNLNSGI